MCLECVHPAKTSLNGWLLAACWRRLCLRCYGRAVCAGASAAGRKGGVYVVSLGRSSYSLSPASPPPIGCAPLCQHVGMGDRHRPCQRQEYLPSCGRARRTGRPERLARRTKSSPRRSRSETSSLPQPSMPSTAAAPTSAAVSVIRACHARISRAPLIGSTTHRSASLVLMPAAASNAMRHRSKTEPEQRR